MFLIYIDFDFFIRITNDRFLLIMPSLNALAPQNEIKHFEMYSNHRFKRFVNFQLFEQVFE